MTQRFTRKSMRVSFIGHHEQELAGILDFPNPPTQAMAIFCHCFTCGKDLKAIARIARGLVEHGIGVLRFDFAGIGGSRGDFSDTTFSTTRDDLRSAYRFLESRGQAPRLLIGMSLGGATVLSMATELPNIQGVALLASPSNTHHLAKTLSRLDEGIENAGQGTVNIGGRSFTIRQAMLDDLRSFDLQERMEKITCPALIIHSPHDETLDFRHALHIRDSVQGPASLLALEQADHLLLSDERDVGFVASSMSIWAKRYVFEPANFDSGPESAQSN